jgi:hypothetical protein
VNIVLLFFVLATLAVLIMGLVVMVKGGETNKKLSNKLMAARVWLQAISIGLILIFFYTSAKH